MKIEEELKKHGILIEKSIPHEQQQNGRAERFNRTIIDKAQALCFQACAPSSWWEFAVSHALHLYNRTPIKRHNWKTPFEILNGQKPDFFFFFLDQHFISRSYTSTCAARRIQVPYCKEISL